MRNTADWGADRAPHDDGMGRGPHRGHGRHDFPGPGGFGPGGFGPGGFGPGGFGPGGPGSRGGRGPRGRSRRGHVRQSILALLVEQPANGYQVMQLLAERTNGMWRPSPGAVYPALSQLEDEGLIESFDNDGQKAFRLTEAGRAAATEIEDTPWETYRGRGEAFDHEAMRALWQEFAALGGAAKELARSGDPDHLRAAAELIAQTRRGIYGLLAGPRPTDTDDLR